MRRGSVARGLLSDPRALPPLLTLRRAGAPVRRARWHGPSSDLLGAPATPSRRPPSPVAVAHRAQGEKDDSDVYLLHSTRRRPRRRCREPAASRSCDRCLQKTSRTFALTIPLLPEPLQTEVATAYLLFRIIDTFEDATRWAPAQRAKALGTVHAAHGETDGLRAPRELTAQLARRPAAGSRRLSRAAGRARRDVIGWHRAAAARGPRADCAVTWCAARAA